MLYALCSLLILEIHFRERNSPASYILFWNFIKDNVNPVFWNLKGIGYGIGNVLNEFLLLLWSSPWKQTDLNDWHWYLLSYEF